MPVIDSSSEARGGSQLEPPLGFDIVGMATQHLIRTEAAVGETQERGEQGIGNERSVHIVPIPKCPNKKVRSIIDRVRVAKIWHSCLDHRISNETIEPIYIYKSA